MIRIWIDPILVRLGLFSLSWHSLFSAIAIIVGVWFTARLARRRGLPVNIFYSMVPWSILGGIVGARLVHVLDYWDVYAVNPGAILAIWEGGLALWGGILGGIVTALIFGKVKGVPIAPLADLAAPGLILAQAIGRIGDIINGEHFSRVTDLPWSVVYTHPNSPAYGLPPQHPAVAYELLMDLLIFGVLLVLRNYIRKEGSLFLVYLISYSVGRFCLSFLRLDSHTIFLGLNQAQWISILVLAVAFPLLMLKLTSRKKYNHLTIHN